MMVKGAKALEVWCRRVTDGYPVSPGYPDTNAIISFYTINFYLLTSGHDPIKKFQRRFSCQSEIDQLEELKSGHLTDFIGKIPA